MNYQIGSSRAYPKQRKIVLTDDFVDVHGRGVIEAYRKVSAVFQSANPSLPPKYENMIEALRESVLIPWSGVAFRLPIFSKNSSDYWGRYYDGLPLGEAVCTIAFAAGWTCPASKAQDLCVEIMGQAEDFYNDASLIGMKDSGFRLPKRMKRFEVDGAGFKTLCQMALES